MKTWDERDSIRIKQPVTIGDIIAAFIVVFGLGFLLGWIVMGWAAGQIHP